MTAVRAISEFDKQKLKSLGGKNAATKKISPLNVASEIQQSTQFTRLCDGTVAVVDEIGLGGREAEVFAMAEFICVPSGRGDSFSGVFSDARATLWPDGSRRRHDTTSLGDEIL